ncbi:glycohydrolase toxin TNT-related protein, partial [Actinophytocola xanthii]
ARPVDAAPVESRGKGAAAAAPGAPAVGKPGGGQVASGAGLAAGAGVGQPGPGRTGSGVGAQAGVGEQPGAGRTGTGVPGHPANQAVGGQPGGRSGSGVSDGAAGKVGGVVGSVPPGQPANQPLGPGPGKVVAGVADGAAAPGQNQPGKQVNQAVGGQPVPAKPVPVHPAADQQAAGHQASADYPGQPVVRERDEALALFWVHMFPIGHMPVAADRPGRQVPPPPPELDYAAGLRFEPGDHPQAGLVETTHRLAALREGAPPVEATEPLGRADLAELVEGHDPLGGEHERDWDRRYQVRFGSVTPEGIRPDGLEFAWPPCEQYPEGGCAEAEAEVLDEGAEIDRFGPPEGRVFAEAGTAFARRSLPPAHLDQGYRRYRVLRPLPVWRALSAAWFAQPGGGVRYRTTHSAVELVALGYLTDITREEP